MRDIWGNIISTQLLITDYLSAPMLHYSWIWLLLAFDYYCCSLLKMIFADLYPKFTSPIMLLLPENDCHGRLWLESLQNTIKLIKNDYYFLSFNDNTPTFILLSSPMLYSLSVISIGNIVKKPYSFTLCNIANRCMMSVVLSFACYNIFEDDCYLLSDTMLQYFWRWLLLTFENNCCCFVLQIWYVFYI